MATAGEVVWAVHALLTMLLAVHSLAYLGLALSRLRRNQPRHDPPSVLQKLTVQIAVRNEPGPLLRCAHAIQRLDWPRNLLEVQVLDDSDDPAPGAQCVDTLRRAGLQAHHVRRSTRAGEKAGALQEGLLRSTGDILVPFDVDFEPEPDFLRSLMAPMHDPAVACVQARWSSRNGPQNLLTRALDVAMAGHFRVEQTVRARVDGLTSFNATACAWRKTDLEAVGGWPTASLTEDLDVATRVRLRGRRFVYLEDLACASQVPATVSALAVQQARWTRGSLHCLRLHAASVAGSPMIPPKRRPGVLFHLGHYSVQPLLLASFAVQATLVLLHAVPAWYVAVTLPVLVAGPLLMYSVALWIESGLRGWLRLMHLPTLAIVGLGLTAHMTIHALLGLAGRRGTFRRTPKDGAPARRAGHRLPAILVAAATLGWAFLAWPNISDPLAAGVLAFGGCNLLVALLR